MHNTCNTLESSWNHSPPTPAPSPGKDCLPQKPVPGVKNVKDHWPSMLILPPQLWTDTWATHPYLRELSGYSNLVVWFIIYLVSHSINSTFPMTTRNNFFTSQPVEVNWAVTIYQKIFKTFLSDNLNKSSYSQNTRLSNTEFKNCANWKYTKNYSLV